jgi:DNA-binding NarL/FixJ family response regulator
MRLADRLRLSWSVQTEKGRSVIETEKASRVENPRLRILLVDDHPIVLQGLTQVVNHSPNLMVCGQAFNAEQALEAIEQLKPDLVVLDISLRGSGGLDLIKTVGDRQPDLPVLVLSMHDESLYAERAIRAGARGYIMKEEATEKLLSAINRVLEGEIYLSETMSRKLLSQLVSRRRGREGSPIAALSDRELEVFQLIGQGYSTREIAEQLHVSGKTVESHREHIKDKLQLRNATELMQQAFQWVQNLSSR